MEKIKVKRLKSAWISAFTLIEMLIVLTIVSFFGLVSIFDYRRILQSFSETIIVSQIESSIKQAQRLAITKQKSYIFGIKDNIVYYSDKSSDIALWSLKLPTYIQCNFTDYSVCFLQNGGISKINSFELNLESTKKVIKYQFQLGSGQYKKEIKQN